MGIVLAVRRAAPSRGPIGGVMRRLGPCRVDGPLSGGLTPPLPAEARAVAFCAVEGPRHSLATQLQLALYGPLAGLGRGVARSSPCGAHFPILFSRLTFGPTYWAWVGGLGRWWRLPMTSLRPVMWGVLGPSQMALLRTVRRQPWGLSPQPLPGFDGR